MKTKHKYRITVTVFLVFVLLFSVPTSAMASEFQGGLDAIAHNEQDDIPDGTDMIPGTGYIEPEYEEVFTDYSDSELLLWASPESLQPYYRNTQVPEIKHQGSYGVCWAFATIGCMEINLMKKGYTNVDLSELHLAYFAKHSALDPLGGLEGDDYTPNEEAGSFLQTGGNYDYSSNALMDWLGAASEDSVPYSMASEVEANGLDATYAFQDVAHLQGMYKINMADMSLVKQAILDYGAVQISYYALPTYTSNAYFNATTAGYYCYDQTTTNHGVIVVGWDDNYSASNFPTEPEGNGAWIVRNSWGADYGDEGYFYLSYYDTSIYSTAVVYDAEMSDNYDNNYQYDGSVGKSYKYLAEGWKLANVFQAKANQEGAESLKAVSFETYTENFEYTISVYKNLTDPEDPESGELCVAKNGSTTYKGIYTILLDEDIYIDQGVYYSIVITVNQASYIAMDKALSSGIVYSATSAQEHQSYLNTGSSWTDYGLGYNTNFGIKAYTCNISKQQTVPVTDITLNQTEVKLGVGKSAQLTATIQPDNATNKAIVWSSSDESIATVDNNGLVKAVSVGTANITARSSNGDVYAICKVTVAIPLTGIAISPLFDFTVNVDNTRQLAVVYSPSNTTDDKTVTWTSSDPTVATVDSTGLVKGINPGTAVITATVGDFNSTCTVTVKAPLNRISINPSGDITVNYNDTKQLSVEYYPSNTTDDKTVNWTSSNTAVATVDSNGLVKGINPGTAVITASVGEVYSTCIVTVKKPLTQIEIYPTSNITINYNDTRQLSVTYYPSDTTDDTSVTWTSSDPTVATVDSTGFVRGINPGVAIITANVGEFSDEITIMVNTDAAVSANGIYVASLDRNGISAGLDAQVSKAADLQYRWRAYNKSTQEEILVKDWADNNSWLNWRPDSFGEYVLMADVRVKYNTQSTATAQTDAFEYNPYIKGKCQLPYAMVAPGQPGYLIGVETYENPNQEYQYEMLILDCTSMQWVYSTGKFTVTEGAAGWCVWQPEYGYYWTLFRVYDKAGNMIDQACYGFVNAY